MFGTLLPRIAEDFGWNQQTALLANTLVSVGVFVVVVLRRPVRGPARPARGMMITIGGAALSSPLTAASTGVASLVGFRALSGLGMAEQSVNATYLNEVFALTEIEGIRKRRGFFYSLVQTGWPIGALLAAAFIAGINGLFGHDSWRIAFLVATVPALFVLFLPQGHQGDPAAPSATRTCGSSGSPVRDREAPGRRPASGSSTTSRPSTAGASSARRYARNTVVLSIAWIVNYFGITTTRVLGHDDARGRARGRHDHVAADHRAVQRRRRRRVPVPRLARATSSAARPRSSVGWLLAGVCWP